MGFHNRSYISLTSYQTVFAIILTIFVTLSIACCLICYYQMQSFSDNKRQKRYDEIDSDVADKSMERTQRIQSSCTCPSQTQGSEVNEADTEALKISVI